MEEGKHFSKLARINQQFEISYDSAGVTRKNFQRENIPLYQGAGGVTLKLGSGNTTYSIGDGRHPLGSEKIGFWVFRNYNPKWPNVQV